MAFLSKADLAATIQAYDIDVGGLNFAQQQGVVSKYLAAHSLKPVKAEQETDKPDNFAAALQAQFAADDGYVENKQMVQPPQAMPVIEQKPVLVKGVARRIQLDAKETAAAKGNDGVVIPRLVNKRLWYSPEIRFNQNMIYRYEEDLGENMEVEELWYNGETLDSRNIQAPPGETSGISGTYKVRPIPHSKLKAMSSVPRQNVGIYWDFDKRGMPKTPFPIAVFEGRRGYLYSHASIPCVKPTIIESGYYEDFKDMLKDEPNIFYLGGSIRAVDIPFCDWMMKEIEDREVYKRGSHIR